MTLRSLHLAKDLALPLEAVTQTIAILAKRRAGKSYTMRRMAEQLHKAGQQIVLVDPKGDQWGIRFAADGKAEGLPIVVLGGERGDVALEAGGGEIVAKLVVEERVSAVLDLSLFRKHEVATFMTAFLENLYRLKAREAYRTPMMLVIDEADAIAPQKPQKGEERMLGAAEDIVRRGGQRGIGCVLVTQRSAVLNKNVLTQAQMLVALRTIAPQDLAAMSAWVDVHGTEEQKRTLMESLPSLPVGDAWFWSPGWPTTDGIFKRVHVLPIETFDSGATPKPGEKPIEPKRAADVDLEALKRQMAATIEKQKADDPRELRKQIAELKSQLSKAAHNMREKGQPRAETRIAEKIVLTDADRALLDRLVVGVQMLRDGDTNIDVGDLADDLASEISKAVDRVFAVKLRAILKAIESKGFQKILDKLSTVTPSDVHRHTPPSAGPRVQVSRVHAGGSRNGARPASDNGNVGKGERTVLIAIAQHPAGVTREQLSVLTGYKRSSRDTYLQRLTAAGLADVNAGVIAATEAGIGVLGDDFDPLPTGDELREHWLRRLSPGERKVLEILIARYPDAVDRDTIDEATGYKRSSRDTYLQRLSARKLVTVEGRGAVKAAEELFS